MNSLILRAVTPLLTVLTLAYSVFVLLRGHNEPGGGFIGGLIAVCGLAIYGMCTGPASVRRALVVEPLVLSGLGLTAAAASGLIGLAFGESFLTGLWIELHLGNVELVLGTPLLFDIGVYLVVIGAISQIALDVEDEGSSP